jgi:hypothetical protein
MHVNTKYKPEHQNITHASKADVVNKDYECAVDTLNITFIEIFIVYYLFVSAYTVSASCIYYTPSSVPLLYNLLSFHRNAV